MQGQLTSRLERKAERLQALHSFEADTGVAARAEAGEQSGLGELTGELTQWLDRHGAQVGRPSGVGPQPERSRPEAEPLRLAVLGDVTESPQRRQDAMNRRDRQSEGAGDVTRGPLRVGLAEDLENREGALQNLEGRPPVAWREPPTGTGSATREP